LKIREQERTSANQEWEKELPREREGVQEKALENDRHGGEIIRDLKREKRKKTLGKEDISAWDQGTYVRGVEFKRYPRQKKEKRTGKTNNTDP